MSKESIREKQIEELTNELIFTNNYGTLGAVANHLYEKGYRKQSEGEWLQGVNNSKVCSICGKEPLYTASETAFATSFYRVKSNFCPNCGAKMKGGAE